MFHCAKACVPKLVPLCSAVHIDCSSFSMIVIKNVFIIITISITIINMCIVLTGVYKQAPARQCDGVPKTLSEREQSVVQRGEMGLIAMPLWNHMAFQEQHNCLVMQNFKKLFVNGTVKYRGQSYTDSVNMEEELSTENWIKWTKCPSWFHDSCSEVNRLLGNDVFSVSLCRLCKFNVAITLMHWKTVDNK